MKLHKKLLSLAAIALTTATVFSVSSCSAFVYILDETSGADSVAGTYTFDISVYDSDFADHTLGGSDSMMGTYFFGKGLTQTNTLVLGSDGTYTYTKEVYTSTEGDTWYDYNLASFMGTYTNSGSTVVLNAVTSVGFESTTASILTDNGLAIPDTEYTESSDLSSTCIYLVQLYTVIDLWYGPYFYNTGKGNVAQTIYLGDYSWGDFTFADDGISSSSDETEEGNEETTETSEEETSETNEGGTN